jgi:NAD(P)-dependent dehydrogenase (short-subunit alcohol dehydrogenase family)
MPSYLVTGSSRGLGFAIVKFLASLPRTEVSLVFATARSETPALKEVVDTSSGRVIFVKVDVTNEASVDEGVKLVEQRVGDAGLDVLINNAGATVWTPGWIEKLSVLISLLWTV